jgi:hypothetical protein
MFVLSKEKRIVLLRAKINTAQKVKGVTWLPGHRGKLLLPIIVLALTLVSSSCDCA